MIDRVLLFLVLFSTAPSVGNAQFDRLLNRTADKIGREVERIAVEKISDVIARKAAEQIEKEFDRLLYESMGPDTVNYNRDSAAYKLGQSYAQFLAGMNSAVELPDTYSFDLDILYTIQGGGEEQATRYYFSRSQPVVGIQTAKSETEWSIIVMDAERDALVMYTHKGDEQTAQTIPNVMGLMSGVTDQDSEQQAGFSVEKTGKKTRIAGYKCEGYTGNSDELRFEAWVTDELGVSWKDAFGPMMERFSTGTSHQQSWKAVDGMVLKSDSYDVATGDLESSLEAREVTNKRFVIENSEYKFPN